MTKKTRLIILLVCVACFFVVAPVLVFYSMGYRFDFHKMKVAATGGIYVRTFPTAEQITIDSKILEKPGMFSNSIFVQSLSPANHTVSIKKDGYYDYFKTLSVQENQVTKLENVLLIKKNIQFEAPSVKTQSPFDKLEKYTIKNNNLYYSDSSENAGIPVAQKTTPILKSILVFSIVGNNIIWLGTDGIMYKSDLTNLSADPIKMTLTPVKITKTGTYKIVAGNQNVFLISSGNMSILNAEANALDNFASSTKDARISPDGKNIVYWSGSKIYLYSFTDKNPAELFTGSISDCQWLNNDYIVFTSGDKIIISEIDYRGNINAVTLPQSVTILPEKKIDISKPQIFFNQQDSKLYILTNKILLVSEKLIP